MMHASLRRRDVLALAPVLCLPSPRRAAASREILIGGSGPVLAAARIVGEAHGRRSGAEVVVLDSLGTRGGLQALRDGTVHLALFARPATEAERAAGLRYVRFADSPLVAATRRDAAEPAPITLAQLAGMMDGTAAAWPDGRTATLIRRMPQEIDNEELSSVSPTMADAVRAMLGRTGPRTARTAQQNGDAIESTTGGLGFITLGQAMSEGRRISQVRVSDGPLPQGGLVMKRFFVACAPDAPADVLALLDALRWNAAGAALAPVGFVPPDAT